MGKGASGTRLALNVGAGLYWVQELASKPVEVVSDAASALGSEVLRLEGAFRTVPAFALLIARLPSSALLAGHLQGPGQFKIRGHSASVSLAFVGPAELRALLPFFAVKVLHQDVRFPALSDLFAGKSLSIRVAIWRAPLTRLRRGVKEGVFGARKAIRRSWICPPLSTRLTLRSICMHSNNCDVEKLSSPIQGPLRM